MGYVAMCMSVSLCLCMSAAAHRGQKGESLDAITGSGSSPMWGLAVELGLSASAAHTFNV